MNFYNKVLSCYEELQRYYPRYYLDVEEMQAILKAFGDIADDLESGIETIYKDTVLSEMSEASLDVLAEYLDISTAGKTVEELRQAILMQFLGGGKVSATRISAAIKAFTGADSECRLVSFDDAGNNRLEITFERGDAEKINMSDIYGILDKILPAHIVYEVYMKSEHDVVVGVSAESYESDLIPCSTTIYAGLGG